MSAPNGVGVGSQTEASLGGRLHPIEQRLLRGYRPALAEFFRRTSHITTPTPFPTSHPTHTRLCTPTVMSAGLPSRPAVNRRAVRICAVNQTCRVANVGTYACRSHQATRPHHNIHLFFHLPPNPPSTVHAYSCVLWALQPARPPPSHRSAVGGRRTNSKRARRVMPRKLMTSSVVPR